MIEKPIEAAAEFFPDPFRLLVRDEVGSTNDVAKELALAGTRSGCVILAKKQSAGRGRRGAAWFSPPSESLAFSILIRPSAPKAFWPRLALAAGLAVAEAIEQQGLQAGIKWPNDVWIHQKKVAGILVEASDDYAIVGIGINVNTPHFPSDIAQIATSLQAETLSHHHRADVLAAIIQRFAIRSLQIEADFPALIEAVRERCVLSGHQASLLVSGEPRFGKIIGISDSGALLFEQNGSIHPLIQADEIRICH